MAKAGFDRRALARQFGISVRTVSRMKAQLGLVRKASSLTDDDLRLVLQELRDGTLLLVMALK